MNNDGAGPRPIRSYVLRQGRMSAAQRRALELHAPQYLLSYAQAPLDFPTVFGRTAPVILEIGCGMGETTAQIAANNPRTDYIGVEVHAPGVGSVLKLASEKGLANLRIVQHDAVEIARHMLPLESLSGVHVFFPDPWPKTRHHKRRLIQASFVSLLASRLKPYGYIHLATDWQEYAEQMLAVLHAESSLENTSPGFATRPAYRPMTKFEQRGIKLGHGVWDLIFRRKD
ncbi:MAG: tRNA (guanosine(46)-N7)-methyltransferase TrmB [Betaproteobacteria bacterium]|nr:tRNA (guanosine(46)-N7)-methyltransferase TrmB [Betaproteobacteria bacterium]